MTDFKNYDVVYFSTTTCTPCKITKPIVEKVSTEKKINTKFYTIDTEENGRDIAMKYKVSSVPTILFYKDGNEVFRNIGMLNEEKFKKLLADVNI
jgi:thioredoxin 1